MKKVLSLIFIYYAVGFSAAVKFPANCQSDFNITSALADVWDYKPSTDQFSTAFVDVIETLPVFQTLYIISWLDDLSEDPYTNDKSDTNTALQFMQYEINNPLKSMFITLNGSLVGWVDYPDIQTEDVLQFKVYFNFTDAPGTLNPCTILLTHKIIDQNTQTPQFENSAYQVDIREDFPVQLTIQGLQPNAFDFDETSPNHDFNIEIVDADCPLGVDGFNFTYDGTMAVVEFVLVTAVDYDTMEPPYQYICDAVLTDYGNPPLSSHSTIIVTVTPYPDEPPAFTTEYYVGDAPSVVAGTLVFVTPLINATDQDVPPSPVTYTMTAVDGSGADDYFEIDPVTADIRISKDLDADILISEIVYFVLTATDDTAMSAIAFLTITLPFYQRSTNCPTTTCEPCNYSSSMLTTLSAVSCPICESCSTSATGSQPSTNSASTLLITTGEPISKTLQFDYDSYVFQALTYFKTIGKVVAEGQKEKSIMYTWVDDGSEGLSLFDIDNSTGVISAVNTETPVQEYSLTAQAYDGTQTAYTTVSIVILDSTTFGNSTNVWDSVYVTAIPEGQDEPSFYTVEGDNAYFFCITAVNPVEFWDSFSINGTTGDLSVTTPLDADDATLGNKIELKVAAYEEETPCIKDIFSSQLLRNEAIIGVNVTDINDNSPVFVDDEGNPVTKVLFAYPSDVSLQNVIGPVATVKAIDIDITSVVTYSFLNDETNFAIEPESGEIFVVGSFNCFTTNCDFTVVASDSVHQANLTISITGLDFNHIFSMNLNDVYITEVDSKLTDISKEIGIDIREIYSTINSIGTNSKLISSQKWNVEAHVYAVSDMSLMTLTEFNSMLNSGGTNLSATDFTEQSVFHPPPNTDNIHAYKVAVGVLAFLFGVILIGLAIFIGFNAWKRKNERKIPHRQVSSLGKAYLNQGFAPTDKEETFASIFGDDSVSKKSSDNLSKSNSFSQNYNNSNIKNEHLPLASSSGTPPTERPSPLHSEPSPTIIPKIKFPDTRQNKPSTYDYESSYFSHSKKDEQSSPLAAAKGSLTTQRMSDDSICIPKDRKHLYPSLQEEEDSPLPSPFTSLRGSPPMKNKFSYELPLPDKSDLISEDGSFFGDKKSNLKVASDIESSESDRKSVAFKVLVDTKEVETENEGPGSREKEFVAKTTKKQSTHDNEGDDDDDDEETIARM